MITKQAIIEAYEMGRKMAAEELSELEKQASRFTELLNLARNFKSKIHASPRAKNRLAGMLAAAERGRFWEAPDALLTKGRIRKQLKGVSPREVADNIPHYDGLFGRRLNASNRTNYLAQKIRRVAGLELW